MPSPLFPRPQDAALATYSQQEKDEVVALGKALREVLTRAWWGTLPSHMRQRTGLPALHSMVLDVRKACVMAEWMVGELERKTMAAVLPLTPQLHKRMLDMALQEVYRLPQELAVACLQVSAAILHAGAALTWP